MNTDTKKTLRPLQWELQGRMWVARSEAYGDTEFGLYWRVFKKARRWRLNLSDRELIAGMPAGNLGPWELLGTAKMACQNEEDEMWREELDR